MDENDTLSARVKALEVDYGAKVAHCNTIGRRLFAAKKFIIEHFCVKTMAGVVCTVCGNVAQDAPSIRHVDNCILYIIDHR